MYTLKTWLNRIDPYCMKRVILHRSLVLAVLLVLVYEWIQPKSLIFYLLPCYTVLIYEHNELKSFASKDRALVYLFFFQLFGFLSFYFLFKFHWFFLLYSIIFFYLFYLFFCRHFPEIKNNVMSAMSFILMVIAVKPASDWNVFWIIGSSLCTSMCTLMFFFRVFRYGYINIWLAAQEKLLATLIHSMNVTENDFKLEIFSEEIQHIRVLNVYQQLLPAKCFCAAYRMNWSIRLIQLAIHDLAHTDLSTSFWITVKKQLIQFKKNMGQRTVCPISEYAGHPKTPLEFKMHNFLRIGMSSWNQICCAFKN